MKFVTILYLVFLFFHSAMSTRDFTRHHNTGYSNYVADDTLKISVSYLTLKETKFIDTYENSPPGVHRTKISVKISTPRFGVCVRNSYWYDVIRDFDIDLDKLEKKEK